MHLRDYQKQAIRAFEANNRIGLFEMATGTGKTITSLFAADNAFHESQRQCLIIIVPYLHLISQWIKNFKFININNYIEISGNKSTWIPMLEDLIWDYNNSFRDRIVIIGSYKSMASKDFQEALLSISNDCFLIADECHNLGSPSYYNHNFNHVEYRLGLSATPRRWWDEVGTELIYKLFQKTVFEYTMEEAIEDHFLTEYYYFPQLVNLTEDEMGVYASLSFRILILMSKASKTEEEKDIIEQLLRKRSLIIQNAENKLPLLLKLLKKQDDLRHTLVYCGIGEIDKVVKSISQLGIRVSRFNSELSMNEREIVLKKFSTGEIEVLVAIKCLDEGVDVPATKRAYFLSSTGNPRQFVQRRGRILRRHVNKKYSVIYDFVVLPETNNSSLFNAIAEREIPRSVEFASLAINKYQSRTSIRKKLIRHNLEEYLELLPWDMYNLKKEKMEEHE